MTDQLTLEQKFICAEFANHIQSLSREELIKLMTDMHEKFWERENQHREALKIAAGFRNRL